MKSILPPTTNVMLKRVMINEDHTLEGTSKGNSSIYAIYRFDKKANKHTLTWNKENLGRK